MAHYGAACCWRVSQPEPAADIVNSTTQRSLWVLRVGIIVMQLKHEKAKVLAEVLTTHGLRIASRHPVSPVMLGGDTFRRGLVVKVV